MVTLTGATLTGTDEDNYSSTSVGTDARARHHARKHDHRQTSPPPASKSLRRQQRRRRSLDAVTERVMSAGDTVSLYGRHGDVREQERRHRQDVTLTGASLTGADAANYALDLGRHNDREHHAEADHRRASPPRTRSTTATRRQW